MATQDVIAELLDSGASKLVYTNVDRDGMLEGPDLDEVRRVARGGARRQLIYSGGIGAAGRTWRGWPAWGEASLDGVIVGKALYERRFTVAQALEALALELI